MNPVNQLKSMNNYFYLFLLLACTLFTACGDCENDTYNVDPDLLTWLTHEPSEEINFLNQDGYIKTYQIERDIDSSSEEDGECVDVTMQPYIHVFELGISEKLLNIWMQHDPDLLGDRDQLWGIYSDSDGSIRESGAININSVDAISSTVVLNGTEYSEVITLELSEDLSAPATIYLQKNEGLIGFQLDDALWSRLQ